jgi:hypothetical protein
MTKKELKQIVKLLGKNLESLYSSYKSLADSGDAGNWKLEDTPEGIASQTALLTYYKFLEDIVVEKANKESKQT